MPALKLKQRQQKQLIAESDIESDEQIISTSDTYYKEVIHTLN